MLDARGAPVPGHQFVEPVSGMSVDHALKHVAEIGVGLDAIELRGSDEGTDDGPAVPTAVAAGEEVVLAPERNGPDGALHAVASFDHLVRWCGMMGAMYTATVTGVICYRCRNSFRFWPDSA